jgi:hypothetical protein
MRQGQLSKQLCMLHVVLTSAPLHSLARITVTQGFQDNRDGTFTVSYMPLVPGL